MQVRPGAIPGAADLTDGVADVELLTLVKVLNLAQVIVIAFVSVSVADNQKSAGRMVAAESGDLAGSHGENRFAGVQLEVDPKVRAISMRNRVEPMRLK